MLGKSLHQSQGAHWHYKWLAPPVLSGSESDSQAASEDRRIPIQPGTRPDFEALTNHPTAPDHRCQPQKTSEETPHRSDENLAEYLPWSLVTPSSFEYQITERSPVLMPNLNALNARFQIPPSSNSQHQDQLSCHCPSYLYAAL